MEVINTFKDIASLGFGNIRLIDARQFEVLKLQKMFPRLNVWSVDYSDYVNKKHSDASDDAGTLTVFPAKSHQYDAVGRGREVMCLGYIGGGLSCS